MAYFTNLARRCAWMNCPSPASVAVFNNRNAHMGDYCKTHGKRRVAELNRQEREAARIAAPPAAATQHPSED